MPMRLLMHALTHTHTRMTPFGHKVPEWPALPNSCPSKSGPEYRHSTTVKGDASALGYGFCAGATG
eukprot:2760307-Amphidinium_carterae.1